MWNFLSEYLMDYMKSLKGGATTQGASPAGNVAAGANNTGWGSMAQDLAKGNTASAAGNAMQMGVQNQQAQLNQQNQQAGKASIPQASAPPTYTAPTTGPGNGQNPYLQMMMQRYMGGQ